MAPPADLPPDVAALLEQRGGLVTLPDLREAGISRARVRTLIGNAQLVPLARATFAQASRLELLGAWDRHRLCTRAFLLAGHPSAVAADWSAIALAALPTLRPPPELPSVIRTPVSRSGTNPTPHGRTRYVRVPDEFIDRSDVPTVRPAFAVCDVARTTSRFGSLVLGDAVARKDGLETLSDAARSVSRWPNAPRAAWVARHADPLAESPLETAGRLVAISFDLPIPVSNVWIGDGFPQWRLDHYWPDHRVAAEGDGAAKYRASDLDLGELMRRRSERDHQVRELGVTMVHYDWTLAVHRPPVLADRFRTALHGPRLPVSSGLRWWTCAEGTAIRQQGS